MDISAAEAGQPFTSTGGRQAWFNLPARLDATTVEFVEFDGGTYRAIKSQRVLGSRMWSTVHTQLQADPTMAPVETQIDFDSADFLATDFA